MPKKESDGLRSDLRALQDEMPQVLRLGKFDNLLSRNLCRKDRLTTAEMFKFAFGDAGETYWRATLEAPMSARLLAWHLARHLVEAPPGPPPKPVPQQLLEEGVLKALRNGIDGGRISVERPITSTSRKDWCDLFRIGEPMAAVQWMSAAAMYQHWVPASLGQLLRLKPVSAKTEARVVPAEVEPKAVESPLPSKPRNSRPGPKPGSGKFAAGDQKLFPKIKPKFSLWGPASS